VEKETHSVFDYEMVRMSDTQHGWHTWQVQRQCLKALSKKK